MKPATLLKAFISLALLGLIAWQVPFVEVWQSLLLTDASWFLASASMMAIIYLLNSQHMVWMAREMELSVTLPRMLAINLAARFYELFLPSAIASGAIRWYQIAQVDNRPAEAMGFMVVSRTLEALMLLLCGLVFFLIDQVDAGREAVFILLLTTLAALATYLAMFSRRAHALGEYCLRAVRVPEHLRVRIAKMTRPVLNLRHLPVSFHTCIFLAAALRHGLTMLALWMLALALGLQVDFVTLAWIRTLVTFAVILPVSVAGFGVRELTFVALLAPYGVMPAEAVALGLLMFARGLIFAVIGGVVEAVRLRWFG